MNGVQGQQSDYASKESNIRAFKFIILLGIVSLFADITYEGARGVVGPFLETLGVSATIVGTVAGFGELVAYSLRALSGYISDRTGKYWAVTLFGYTVGLLAIPAIALTERWEIAVFLLILERFGKAMRNPPRDAMLSHATAQVGHGFGFGLHEALDQVGAILGPAIVSTILFAQGTYRSSFAVLLVPALTALLILLVARIQYPTPREIEISKGEAQVASYRLPRAYWLYLTAVACIGAGFTNYILISYHFERVALVPKAWIAMLYALAMGVDAVAALGFGKLFDRIGLSAMSLAVGFSAFFSPLVFFGGLPLVIVGIILWGIGMGAQESIMRAAVAHMISPSQRATAYGILNTIYGVSWFAGGMLMGYLYDSSLTALVLFSITVQLLSIPMLLMIKRFGIHEQNSA
jgi:MFS family permease